MIMEEGGEGAWLLLSDVLVKDGGRGELEGEDAVWAWRPC